MRKGAPAASSPLDSLSQRMPAGRFLASAALPLFQLLYVFYGDTSETKLILDLLKNCIEGGLDIANGFSLSFISLVFQFEDTFWSSIGVGNPINTAKLSASILTISLSLITYLR